MLASQTPSGRLGRLGRWAATHRRAVVLAWVGVALSLGALAPRAEHALSGGGWQADGSESVEARGLIDRHFDGQGSYALAVVVSSQAHDGASPAFRTTSDFAPVRATPLAIGLGDTEIDRILESSGYLRRLFLDPAHRGDR